MKTSNLSFESLAMLTFCCRTDEENEVTLNSQEWNLLEKRVRNCGFKNVSALLSATQDDLLLLLNLDIELVEKMMLRLSMLPKIIAHLAKLERKGIYVLTKYDKHFPIQFSAMRKRSPLYFFVSGDIKNLQNGVTLVGKKTLTVDEISISKKLIESMNKQEYVLVSNDSKGIDAFTMRYVLEQGGRVVCFLANDLNNKIKEFIPYIRSGKLTLLCTTSPKARFSITDTLEKNTFACAYSEYYIVVSSVLNAGETWFCALQNMHYQWTKTLVYANESVANARLIDMGGVVMSKNEIMGNKTFGEIYQQFKETIESKIVDIDQMSIFDFIGE